MIVRKAQGQWCQENARGSLTSGNVDGNDVSVLSMAFVAQKRTKVNGDRNFFVEK